MPRSRPRGLGSLLRMILRSPFYAVGDDGPLDQTQTVTVAVTVGALLAYSSVAAYAATGIVAVTGTLVAPTRQAVAGALMAAAVEPGAQQLVDLPAGAEVSPMSIGGATTTAAGMFSLPVTDFGPGARAADDESVVSVALSAESPKGQLFYRV